MWAHADGSERQSIWLGYFDLKFDVCQVRGLFFKRIAVKKYRK